MVEKVPRLVTMEDILDLIMDKKHLTDEGWTRIEYVLRRLKAFEAALAMTLLFL